MFKKVLFRSIFVLLGLLAAMTAVNAQDAHFKAFLQEFPKGNLPYVIEENNLRHHLEVRPTEQLKRLSWEYYEMLPDLEENMRNTSMPVYPEPVVYFETESHYAVVYNTGRKFARQFKTYNIAVFDKAGHYVASRCIAGVNPTALAAAIITPDLQVTIREYRVEWNHDYYMNGLENNNIRQLNPVRVRTVDAKLADKSGDWDFRVKSATPSAMVFETR
jgi:hypothetical protein